MKINITIVVVYLLTFAFAVYMGMQVEKTRIHYKHKQEAYWHQAR